MITFNDLLQGYLTDIELLALLLALSIFILLATRSVFQLDSNPRTRAPFIPGDEAELVPEFRYMSHFAEDARRQLLTMGHFLRFAMTLLAPLLVFSFAADAFFLFVAGSRETNWWQNGDFGRQLLHNAFTFLTLAAITLLIFWSAEIIFWIIKAHDQYQDKKTYTIRP